ncbi:hypothetical protein BD310DRAFT_6538 [Dichomitus squalens]|uniref:Uncharacterized protein n=1 Tax=Dichomitus squalens TaxID=114155 RepID=A0A4Q9QDH0_9APHY|nr:hypothetical protein BD310DRAFT_6538 [Dichomitus squalens]
MREVSCRPRRTRPREVRRDERSGRCEVGGCAAWPRSRAWPQISPSSRPGRGCSLALSSHLHISCLEATGAATRGWASHQCSRTCEPTNFPKECRVGSTRRRDSRAPPAAREVPR